MNKLLAASLLILIGLLGVDKYSKYQQEETKNEINDNGHSNYVIETPKKEVVLDVALYAKSYKEAKEMSEKNDRNIFIFFEADWCGWCKKMKADVLSDEEVKKELESKYIIFYADVDKEKVLSAKYKIKSIPEFLILSKDENVLIKNSGYLNKEQFLNSIESKYKTLLKDG